MILRLIREPTAFDATHGSLYLNGVWQCWTLEDAIRPTKVAGQTAIPAGTYPITLYDSPKQGQVVPLLRDVPGFTMIEIHPGNTITDTAGCVLVGQTRGLGNIGGSRLAFAALMAILQVTQDPITIRLEDPVLT